MRRLALCCHCALPLSAIAAAAALALSACSYLGIEKSGDALKPVSIEEAVASAKSAEAGLKPSGAETSPEASIHNPSSPSAGGEGLRPVGGAAAADVFIPGAGSPLVLKAPESRPGETPYAIFETSKGRFICELFESKAPLTVRNFIGLASGSIPWQDPKTGQWVQRPFYDNLTFHRVVQGFIIQGGCPNCDGTGHPGFQIQDEFANDLRHDKPGRLGMATAGGPNTVGSQFYITLQPAPHLDGVCPIFGQVTEGMDVVQAIAQTPADPQTFQPAEQVVIERVWIARR